MPRWGVVRGLGHRLACLVFFLKVLGLLFPSAFRFARQCQRNRWPTAQQENSLRARMCVCVALDFGCRPSASVSVCNTMAAQWGSRPSGIRAPAVLWSLPAQLEAGLQTGGRNSSLPWAASPLFGFGLRSLRPFVGASISEPMATQNLTSCTCGEVQSVRAGLGQARFVLLRELLGGVAEHVSSTAIAPDAAGSGQLGGSGLGPVASGCASTIADPPRPWLPAHRLEAATKMWGKWRHLLATPALAVHARVHKTYETVVASALWGSPLWAASSWFHGALSSAK